DCVLLDFGAAFDGYCADTTRMAVVGEPSERHRSIHGLVLEARDAAIEAVRAGATTGAIDAAARHVIDAAGMGDRFIHRVGHGLGLEAHEDPSLDPGSATVLEAGMVFTIEPGVYIPGFGGVRIEDDVLVERSGCRLLTKQDRSLRVIGVSAGRAQGAPFSPERAQGAPYLRCSPPGCAGRRSGPRSTTRSWLWAGTARRTRSRSSCRSPR